MKRRKSKLPYTHKRPSDRRREDALQLVRQETPTVDMPITRMRQFYTHETWIFSKLRGGHWHFIPYFDKDLVKLIIFSIKTCQWKERFLIKLGTPMVDQAMVRKPYWIGNFTFSEVKNPKVGEFHLVANQVIGLVRFGLAPAHVRFLSKILVQFTRLWAKWSRFSCSWMEKCVLSDPCESKLLQMLPLV